MIQWVLALLSALPLLADSYLLASFRGNGNTGLFLASSSGRKTWTALSHGQPWSKPEHQGMLMRNPWLGRGPDGDRYETPQHHGAMQTKDWKTFVDFTDQVHFPQGQRHGTVVKISDSVAASLRSASR